MFANLRPVLLRLLLELLHLELAVVELEHRLLGLALPLVDDAGDHLAIATTLLHAFFRSENALFSNFC